jgi:micrococcal nuclease
MRTVLGVAAVLALVVLGSGLDDDSRAPSVPSVGVQVEEPVPVPASPTGAPLAEDVPATSALLRPAPHGDGDSWRDTAGTEYRLGLVNAPEVDECFGAEATAERRRLVAAGFRAEVYTVDRYGRGVSVITTADGRDLAVELARHGFVDDRYLAQFRHERPSLAAELDGAFAEARAQERGLWSACAAEPKSPAPAPVAAAAPGCHPDYSTCIPMAGNGSGNGGPNDLDCGDVQGPVQSRRPGVDPYRLDADGDGVGCDA